MKKRICILYTGGTIGMVLTENGYSPKEGYFSEALNKIPDLNAQIMPSWDVIEFSPLLDSSNIALDQWTQIGRSIKEKYNDYDGFVVLHGTDTMAYTASALSFMLENIGKPVILTGSQIPLCEIRSDARDNLITSMLIAAEGKVKEVCLYFGNNLLRGNRSTKISADGLIAFDSPNFPHLAEAGINIKYNENLLFMPDNKKPFCLREFQQISIGVLKIFPGIQFNLFESIMTEQLNGIVLETFGAGNIPSYDNALLPIIKKAFDHGAIICVCSQCQQGTVKLGTYETSSALTNAGAVSGADMTTEAAVAKLYYLFSQGYSKNKITKLMETNLRGELSPQ